VDSLPFSEEEANAISTTSCSASQERFQDLPPLPPKSTLLDQLTFSKFLSNRKIMLENYLQELLSESQLFQSSEVRSFLEPANNSQLKRSKGSSEETFLLAPPSSSVKIPRYVKMNETKESEESTKSTIPEESCVISESLDPEYITFQTNQPGQKKSPREHNQYSTNEVPLVNMSPASARKLEQQQSKTDDVCFVMALLDSIKENLEFFTCIHKEMIEARQEQKNPFESNRQRIPSVVQSLKAEIEALKQLIQHKDVMMDKELCNYFESCIRTIEKGLKWQANMEDEFVEQMIVQFSQCDSKQENQSKLIEGLSCEAEQLVVEMALASSSENGNESTLRSKYHQLNGRLNVTLDGLDDNSSDVAKRIEGIQTYLKEYFPSSYDLDLD